MLGMKRSRSLLFAFLVIFLVSLACGTDSASSAAAVPAPVEYTRFPPVLQLADEDGDDHVYVWLVEQGNLMCLGPSRIGRVNATCFAHDGSTPTAQYVGVLEDSGGNSVMSSWRVETDSLSLFCTMPVSYSSDSPASLVRCHEVQGALELGVEDE